jgi:hypothetical protein
VIGRKNGPVHCRRNPVLYAAEIIDNLDRAEGHEANLDALGS